MKKIVLILLVLVLIGGSMWWAWALTHSGQASVQDPSPKTTRIASGDIEAVIEATGSVESNLDVDIKCKASGEVLTLPYDVSASVPKYVPGQNEDKALLVALDPVDEDHNEQQASAAVQADNARLEQANSNLTIAREYLRTGKLDAQAGTASATARVEMARLTLKRQEQLFERKVSTLDELDTARTAARVAEADLLTAQSRQESVKALEVTVTLRQADVDLATANLNKSKVALADARQRLRDTKIYSPIAGVITSRPVQVGQIVASGIVTVGGGTTLMTVSDMSHIFVVAAVDESDIGHLYETQKLRQEVTITADAYPGRRFGGQVVQITPRGTVESNVVTYPVKIEVLGEGRELLLPKMTANVKIRASRRPNVLLAPNAAIRYDKERPYVELVRDGKAQVRWVKLGLNDGTQAEVVEGLSEGDQVVLGASVTKWINESKTPATTGSGPPENASGDGRDSTR